MPSLIDALRQDHSRMTRLLDALERQIAAFRDGGTLDFEIADAILHYCRHYPGLHHHPQEDLIFERLKQRAPEAAAALGDLKLEHQKLGGLMEIFATALDAVEQDTPMERSDFTTAAATFLDAYRHHILMEEKHFFPLAVARLNADDWRELLARAERTEDPLFKDQGDARYKALYKDVMTWEQSFPANA